MICPNCRSENVTFSVVNEVTEKKKKKSLIYWLLIGWWWEIIAWLCFTLFRLLFLLFGKHTKIESRTVTYAVCQDCGNRWEIEK